MTMTATFKPRWLAAVRSTPSLSPLEKKVAHWLVNNLDDGETTVRRTWQQLRNEMKLPNHAAGFLLNALGNAGFVGERIRTGPGAGFPLTFPAPKSKVGISSSTTSADIAAINAKRAKARREADRRADAKWLGK
jgi:hypothetical protein